MEYVADRQRNPFGLDPPCEHAVPGYGDTNAHFHVVGDHPGVHGGTETGVPFTEQPWSERFFSTLARGGLVETFDPDGPALDAPGTFLSYRSMCPLGVRDDRVDAQATHDVDAQATHDVDAQATHDVDAQATYAEMEPFFDAELRAITAHVLLPVGTRATEHVLGSYTSLPSDRATEESHASALGGAGWLVVPVADPAGWTDDQADRLADTLSDLRGRDYRQQSDLGRFFPGEEAYLVR